MKMDAVNRFHPARMADRILGMGDIVSLVERAQEQYDEEEAKRLQKKIQKTSSISMTSDSRFTRLRRWVT